MFKTTVANLFCPVGQMGHLWSTWSPDSAGKPDIASVEGIQLGPNLVCRKWGYGARPGFDPAGYGGKGGGESRLNVPFP